MPDFLSKLIGHPRNTKSSGSWADRLWEAWTRGAVSKAGPSITVVNALRVSVVLSCCRVLAEGIAQLPFKLLREVGDTKLPAREHPLYRVLWRRPNAWMTSFEFRETLMYHAILCRGGFAIINRVRGEVKELLPVLPGRVKIIRSRGDVSYEIQGDDGSWVPFPRESIFHLRGPSWDSVNGMELLDLAREAIGLAIATEEAHSHLHRNGARVSGVIGMDGQLKPEARDRLKAAIEEATTGGNSFRTLVLDQSAKFTQMSMTGVDAQHLETRLHQIEEICRDMRVFPQMVGHTDKTATYASAEQFFLAHVIHSLGPWIERWEQAVDRDMLTDDDVEQGYISKFNVYGLLRGDAASRSDYFASGITNGWLTRNEARSFEDLNPIPGLDEPLVPLNMVNIDQTAEDIAKELAANFHGVDVKQLQIKVGRVLSAKNEKRVRDAQTALTEVLSELDKEAVES